MVGHFEGTIKGAFQPKARGEYRNYPNRIMKKPDLEKIFLRALCIILLIIVLYQNFGKRHGRKLFGYLFKRGTK